MLRVDRNFRHYWSGQAAASAGAQVTGFAMPLVTVLALSGGPAEVSLVAAAGMLPYLLFALVAGHLLQGRDQRRSMIGADLTQVVLLAQVPLAWSGGWLSVPLLAAVAFCSGCCALIFGLSAFSFVPALVSERELGAANRAVQGTSTVSEIAGPGLAGLLVAALGAPLALLATLLGHLASAAGVATSRPAGRASVAAADEPTARSSPLAGLRILFTDRYLAALTVHAAVYNAAEQILLLNLIFWAVQEQAVSPEVFGLALSAAGLGGLLGTLTALRWASRWGVGRAFALSLVLSCGPALVLPLWDLTAGTLALLLTAVMMLRGIGEGNANVYSLTMRQRLIPRQQLTRSAGAYTQIMYGSIPVGALLAGVIGEVCGARGGVALGAVGLAVSAVPMFTPTVLRMRGELEG